MDNIFEIKKTVLVLSVDPRVLAEIKKGLMDTFEIILASTATAAVSAIGFHTPAAAIICCGTGGDIFASRDLLAVRAAAGEKQIPVLFLAERDDEQLEHDAFEVYGAVDYSVRRRITGKPLADRIALRIRANEAERFAAEMKKNPSAEKIVLIAEDIILNQEIMDAMLSETEGFTFEFANDGADALEKFKKNMDAYVLILMDIHMPKMDGLSAAKKIRHLGSQTARSIPIVALTASTGEDDVAMFIEAGMNGYLEKPVDYEKLMDVLKLYV